MPNPETTDLLEALAVQCERAMAHEQRSLIWEIAIRLRKGGDRIKWMLDAEACDSAALEMASNLMGLELSLDQNDRWHCVLSTTDLGGDGEARAASKALAITAAALRASKDTSHGR